jgi:hypothetical protein
MKKLVVALLLVLMLSGCTTHNSKGDCIGLADEKVAGVKYDLSYWNLVLAFVFSETIVVPVVVLAKDLECPRVDQ